MQSKAQHKVKRKFESQYAFKNQISSQPLYPERNVKQSTKVSSVTVLLAQKRTVFNKIKAGIKH